jgi:hypothetical protein
MMEVSEGMVMWIKAVIVLIWLVVAVLALRSMPGGDADSEE